MTRLNLDNLPPAVLAVWDHLPKDTFLVGGLVRDMLRGEPNDDYDFTTLARPDEVESAMAKAGFVTIPTGKAFGTITVIAEKGTKIEVTTFRSESYDGSSRKPAVLFGHDLSEDVSRRDFTINAMALSRDGTLIDYHGGAADLIHGVVRAVGNPVDRFKDDPLRILRAARFAAKIGAVIEDDTLAAMKRVAGRTINLSRERVTDELRKILLTPHPHIALRLLKESTVLGVLFPELDSLTDATHKDNPYHLGDAWEHTRMAVLYAEPDYLVRLATLYHDVGKPVTESYDEKGSHYYGHPEEGEKIWLGVALRDKYSTEMAVRVGKLIRHHLRPAMFKNDSNASLRRIYRDIGDDWKVLVAVSRADVLAHAHPDLSAVKAFSAKMESVAATALPPHTNPLGKGSGSAVIAAFGVSGSEVGRLLKVAEQAFIDGTLTDPSPEAVVAFLAAKKAECNACTEPERYDDHLCMGGFGT